MKSGIALIEVLIATAIAGILGTALITSFFQMNRSTRLIEDYTSTFEKAAVVHQQFERDLLGVFVPRAALKEDKEAEKPPRPGEPAAPSSKEEPEKRLTKVFFATQKDKNLELLTFITANPLQVYWSAKAGRPKPRSARVVYRLIKDKESATPSFKLVRQESSELDFEKYDQKSGIRAFEIIDGIKSLSIEYAVAVEPKEGAKEEQKKKKKEYKKSFDWNVEKEKEAKETKEASKKTKKLFPDNVTIKLSLWDDQKRSETDFEQKIVFVADGMPLKASEQAPQTNVLENLASSLPTATPKPGSATPKPTIVPPGMPSADKEKDAKTIKTASPTAPGAPQPSVLNRILGREKTNAQ